MNSGMDVGPIGGSAVGFAGRPDIRVLLRKSLAMFKAAEPWRETLDEYCCHSLNRDGEVTEVYPWKPPARPEDAIAEALAIRQAIGVRDTLLAVQNDLEDAMEPPPEALIRVILIEMLKVLKSKPNEGSDTYITALVFELAEPETGDPISAPAIVAAAREIWNKLTFAPSIAEFMPFARKHQKRIEAVMERLELIVVMHSRATEILKQLAPEKLPNRRPCAEDEDWDDC